MKCFYYRGISRVISAFCLSANRWTCRIRAKPGYFLPRLVELLPTVSAWLAAEVAYAWSGLRVARRASMSGTTEFEVFGLWVEGRNCWRPKFPPGPSEWLSSEPSWVMRRLPLVDGRGRRGEATGVVRLLRWAATWRARATRAFFVFLLAAILVKGVATTRVKGAVAWRTRGQGMRVWIEET